MRRNKAENSGDSLESMSILFRPISLHSGKPRSRGRGQLLPLRVSHQSILYPRSFGAPNN